MNTLACFNDSPQENETFGADVFSHAVAEVDDSADNGSIQPDETTITIADDSHEHHPHPQPRVGQATHHGHHQPTTASPSPLPAPPSTETKIPLRHWIHTNGKKASSSLSHHHQHHQHQSSSHQQHKTKLSIIKKTTVAYAIAELLQYNHKKTHESLANTTTTATTGDSEEEATLSTKTAAASSYSGNDGDGQPALLQANCNLDNFIVRIANNNDATNYDGDDTIEGVDMIIPPLSLRVISPFFLSDDFWNTINLNSNNTTNNNINDNDNDVNAATTNANNSDQNQLGKFVEVEIIEKTSAATSNNSTSTTGNNNGSIMMASSVCYHHDNHLGSSLLSSATTAEELACCHLFGVLLYELYSTKFPFSDSTNSSSSMSVDVAGNHTSKAMHHQERDETFFTLENGDSRSNHSLSLEGEPLSRKKKTFLSALSFHEEIERDSMNEDQNKTVDQIDQIIQNNNNNNNNDDDNNNNKKFTHATQQVSRDGLSSNGKPSKYVPLKELGFPSSLSLLVTNLLDCGWGEFRPDNALPSLEAASKDLHLLLLDPERFLFDRMIPGHNQGGGGGGKGTGLDLDYKQNKVYGRETERSLISDVFCRVSFTGESEALFVEGFSGSGKSSLVQSVVEYIDVAGAYIIQKKFDQISQERPMSVVIAAFDDLCHSMSKNNSPQELHAIVVELMQVFGAQLSALVRLLPSVAMIMPNMNAQSGDCGQDAEINMTSVYFILQLFARVISSKSHPIMIFFDDLHWADSASLDVLQHILSDIKGESCVFMIGSFRSNEVNEDHPVTTLMNSLERCNVRLSRLHLDGMDIEGVNHIISDALGTFPRICKPLSQLVLRKTKGNPLFVLECLRSLVDRDLLHYSIRERRWVWDTDIISRVDITDDVCELLSVKMIGLLEKTQAALKISSCFGTSVNSTIIKTLMSASPLLQTFQEELDKVVDDGFMDKDDLGSTYTFVHDKVREAAYGLIPEEDRNRFHYDIGMLLFNTIDGESIDGILFFMVDQINHGTTYLSSKQRITMAELNHRAASKAVGNSNFAAAFFYSNAAMKLLPANHWESHYDLSRKIFLVLGNAARSCGRVTEATSALDEILKHGKSLKDKLDAYYLKIALLNTHQELKKSFDTCVEVLKQLGETIPATVDLQVFVKRAEKVLAKLNVMTENDMKTMKSPFHVSLLQFYDQACFASYFVQLPMMKWLACRMVEISLEHGFSKYSALGLMLFTTVLAGDLVYDVHAGYRIGKIALKLLKRFDANDLLPNAYLIYYSFTAVHIEPIQSCAAMLKRGFEIALSTGDTQIALVSGVQYIQKSLLSGANLLVLKKECDYQMRLVETHFQSMTKMYVLALQETISMLITREAPSNPTLLDQSKELEFSQSIIFHNVIQNFWLGRWDRCLYYAERSSAPSDIGDLRSIMIVFYGGLSCFHSSRKGASKKSKLPKQAIALLREKGEQSSWNYQSKIYLLEAEILSSLLENDRAKFFYNSAISAARSSKFIHEEGLACEFSALHCLKFGDKKEAFILLEQARECYMTWGSQVKVDSVSRLLEKCSG